MKPKYITFALLGLIGVSCSNQDLEEKYTDAGQVQVTADITKSRVSFNEADDMTYAYWQTGDAITLSTPTQGNLNYTATVSEDDATVATFAPEEGSLKDIDGETVYACYPAASITDGVVTLPATHTWTDAQPLPFAYAVSSITDSKVDLAFDHTFAFLKLTLSAQALKNATSTDGEKTVHRLSVKSSSGSLGVVSGTFNFEDKSVSVTEGSDEIIFTLSEAFNPSEETERSVYIPVLPQESDVTIIISLLHDYGEGKDVLMEIGKRTPKDGLLNGCVYSLAFIESLCIDDNHPHIIDLGLPSGTKWSCCNVGANSPKDYGGYYSWGEIHEKENYNASNYLNPDVISDANDVAFVSSDGIMRMPTKSEIDELHTYCTWTWINYNGVIGAMVEGETGVIFLPAAAFKDDNYSHSAYGYYGSYWGRDFDGTIYGKPCGVELIFGVFNTSSHSYNLEFYHEFGSTGWAYCGRSIRPVYISE